MKQLPLLFALLLALAACSYDEDVPQCTLSVTLAYPEDVTPPGAGVRVELRSQTGMLFADSTDAQGTACFTVSPGIYEASASSQYVDSTGTVWWRYSLNGVRSMIVVSPDSVNRAVIDIRSSRKRIEHDLGADQLIIKEIYNGGCLRDDGSFFQFDKCIVLYNNCPQRVVAADLCIGMASPYNAQANNYNYDKAGNLTYDAQGFLPAINGIWYFPDTLVVEPYAQVVVNVCGAIDNTLTVTASVNYACADYYAMYDPESGYVNTSYYPTPSALIPTSHYLKAQKVGLGNAWPMSVTSPAVYIFQPKGVTPADFAENADNLWYDGDKNTEAAKCLKVPVEWVIDGVEVFTTTKREDCKKRLTASVDAGYVWLTNYLGHALYRNVDRAATEALPENAGLLVYGYALGADGATDPSGIDAEASMRQGAHIVFQDTNNSTADFHERQQCSLRD